MVCSMYDALHDAQITKKKKAKKKRKDSSSVDDQVISGSEESYLPPVGLPASQGRQYTVSIALPGSIIENAQTQELKTYLAGQVRGGKVCNAWLSCQCEHTHPPTVPSLFLKQKMT